MRRDGVIRCVRWNIGSILVVVGQGAHVDKGHHFQSSRRLGWRRWIVDVDPGRPKAVAVFLGGGTIGWALLGAVIAFAPSGWVIPVLFVSFICVAAQYAAWWRLGGRIGMLLPPPVKQMGRILGVPDPLSTVLVYASAGCLVSGAIVRSIRGAAPMMTNRHWIAAIGAGAILVGAIPYCVVSIRSDGFWGSVRNEWVGQGPRAMRRRQIEHLPLAHWAGEVFIGLSTLGSFLIVLARLG
jgi:hypothetical protein